MSWIMQMVLRASLFCSAQSLASRFHSIARDEQRRFSREEFHRSIEHLYQREKDSQLHLPFTGTEAPGVGVASHVQPSTHSFKPSPMIFSAHGPAGEISSDRLSCSVIDIDIATSSCITCFTRPLVKATTKSESVDQYTGKCQHIAPNAR